MMLNELEELLSGLHLDLVNAPPILYHYTSMQALLSIVESGRLRATHVRFLNDRSEVETMWEIVNRRLHERMDAAQTTADKESLAEIIKLAASRPVLNEFVASFSEKRDDLSQWRSYCPDGVGFNIGFSSRALRTQWVSDPSGGNPSFVGAQLVKVRYVDDAAVSEIDLSIDVVMRVASYIKGPIDGISRENIIVSFLSVMAPSFKHSAFRDEGEWRMVFSKSYKPMPGRRFRPGKSTVVPFVEVELNKDSGGKPIDSYIIKEVVVGPTPNAALSIEALNNLFESKGHPDVKIGSSSIPYRHW